MISGKVKKLGLILSTFAILWLVIPCASHCKLLSLDNWKTQENPGSHDCCDTHEKSNSSSKDCDNGLKQLCISSADSYTSAPSYHYPFFKITIEKNNVALLNHVSSTDKTIHAFDKNSVASPPKIISQLFIANLNTPHAPPVLS